MDRLFNALKAQAAMLDGRLGQPRFGIVTSVNTKNATARVALQPENVITGWLPVLSQWTGTGQGVLCPPAPGDQVLVIPQEGDGEQGVIVGRAFSDSQPPPDVPVGELWIVHRSGSSLRLLDDGTIHIKGDLIVDGDVYNSHGSLDRLRNHYNQHRHKAANGADTSGPEPRD